jgi:hypothetical protein
MKLYILETRNETFWLMNPKNIQDSKRKNIFIYFITGAGVAQSYRDWLRAGRPRGRSSSPGRVKYFLFSTSSRQALRPTQPPIRWIPGGGGLSPGVKRPRRETDHSYPSSAEVKKMWIYISTPNTPSWRSHRDNFTLFYNLSNIHECFLLCHSCFSLYTCRCI